MATSRSTSKAASRRQLVVRVLADRDAIAARLVSQAREDIPTYGPLDPATLTPTTSTILHTLLSAVSDQRPLSDEDLAGFRRYGEVRARQEISLVDLMRAWRTSILEVLGELTTIGRTIGAGDRLLLELTHELLATVDQATMAFTGGHREVELERARFDQQHRADFTRALVLGTLGPTEIQMQSQQFGIDADGEYRAFRARPNDEVRMLDLQRLIRPIGSARGFTTTIDGDLAGFVDRTHNIDIAVPVGFGTPERLTRLDRSFRVASRVMATANAFGMTGPSDLERLGLLPAVVADAELGDELVRRFVTPLGTGEAARVLVDTVSCYLDTGMRIERTAELLIVHPNTVRYRLGRFEEFTGIDLRTPHSALQAWWAIKRASLTPD